MPKLYISGQISGLPPGEARREFQQNAKWLQSHGYDTLDPHDIGACSGQTCGGKTIEGFVGEDGTNYLHDWSCYLKYDIRDMMLCDGVALLENWVYSAGARFEMETAQRVRIPTFPVQYWINKRRGEYVGVKG